MRDQHSSTIDEVFPNDFPQSSSTNLFTNIELTVDVFQITGEVILSNDRLGDEIRSNRMGEETSNTKVNKQTNNRMGEGNAKVKKTKKQKSKKAKRPTTDWVRKDKVNRSLFSPLFIRCASIS